MNPWIELGHCNVCYRRVHQAADGSERTRPNNLHRHARGWTVRREDDRPVSDRP